MPMSVHMFGLRFLIDSMQRMKNGSAAQSTTGLATASSIQAIASSESGNKREPPMARASVSPDSGSVHQKRRAKSSSSGFFSSSSVGISGSSAMPQIGHVPGPG